MPNHGVGLAAANLRARPLLCTCSSAARPYCPSRMIHARRETPDAVGRQAWSNICAGVTQGGAVPCSGSCVWRRSVGSLTCSYSSYRMKGEGGVSMPLSSCSSRGWSCIHWPFTAQSTGRSEHTARGRGEAGIIDIGPPGAEARDIPWPQPRWPPSSRGYRRSSCCPC